MMNMMASENAANVQGNNAMMNTQGGNVMMASENVVNPQGSSAMMNTQGALMMASENAVNMQGNVAAMNTQGGNVMMATENAVNGMTNTQQGNNAMMATENSENNLSNVQGNLVVMNPQGKSNGATTTMNALGKNTRIMYYDPSAGSIPETVYDADGKAYPLSSLQNDKTEIYMEKATLEMPEYTWGESQAQDQMIIVSTVATMALLVGALSARRLRSRQFLNSCIENESLEDEVAYDAAYTTNGYDTFGSGPWRGDLEKFDV
jgi:hypothetical protein